MLTPEQIKSLDQVTGIQHATVTQDSNAAKARADKIRGIGAPAPTQAKPVENGLIPSFRYDAPLNQEQKVVQAKNVSNDLTQKADQANSFGGMVKNTFTAPAMENLPFVGGAIALSKTANKAIDNPFDRETNKIKTFSDTNVALMKQIRHHEAEGTDTTRLKQLYNENADAIDKSSQTMKSAQSSLPTTGNLAGQVLHTTADALTAGTYGKETVGMQSGKLATSKAAPALVQSAEEIAKKKAGLFTAQGGKNVAKATLKGLAYAYPYDTAMGLEGKRGEERTGTSALIPGKITAMGGAISGGLAVATGLKNSAVNALQTSQAEAAGKADKLAGKIARGDIKDIPKIKSAVSQIDVKDIKTGQDFSKRLGDKISESSEALDKTLATDTRKIKLEDAVLESKIGKGEGASTVSHNYIQDGIDKLKELYTKTNDPEHLQLITQLEDKANTEGLTVKEYNDLSRDFGNEFSKKAFSKAGEPLTSVNAQALENIRSGIKSTARDFFGNPVYAASDKKLSDLIQTKNLVDNLNEDVNTLQNKIADRSFGEKVGRLFGKITDTLTWHSVTGYVQSFFPKGQGLKTMNAIDWQNSLQDNLDELKSIIDSGGTESTIATKLQAFYNNIKNTPNKEGGFVNFGEPLKEGSNLGGLDMTDTGVTNNADLTYRPKEVVPGLDKVPKNADTNLVPKAPSNLPNFPSTDINPAEVQIKNASFLDKGRKYGASLEGASEQAGGWQPGMKEMFDTALHSGDKMLVKALIRADAIPVKYKELFASEIANIIK